MRRAPQILLLLMVLLPTSSGHALAAPCRPVEGLKALLEPRAVVLFGELHGTVESPAFVANVMCHALEAGHKVTLALEYPLEEREALAAFLASDGGVAAREALLVGPFWQREFQDGRSSQAMFGLIEEARRLRKAGQPVELFVFDSTDFSENRDLKMAHNLRAAIDSAPDRLFLVLTGNLHSRLAIGRDDDPAFVPMGYTVKEGLEGRRVIALDVAVSGGEFWACYSPSPADCGPKQLTPKNEGEQWKVTPLEAEPTIRGHHGRYLVGTAHVSPPQVGKETKP